VFLRKRLGIADCRANLVEQISDFVPIGRRPAPI
jgi:hypothetical protein